MKICNRCKEEKRISEFSRNKNGKNGRHSLCKKCKVEQGQMRQFGITTADALLVTQNCHICNLDLSKTRACIDHDHKTGLVRGILCSNCNAGLGKLGDDVEGLERALRYLTSPPLIS